ncbi:YegS/Rv2252/BmrU family lipid kinase [Segniliparus rugosus]|uniref:YegS BmrU family lipid kinase n=1 Tax=Segniliparus rugosus (strain ATCC BAA-974 / DSM 45345 / CCUG 50838 / CIP 108380 / JCM 13579 / CDC 945) TaxID=679197 RepID=E5XUP8_SEGRC|nr:YegS/Rv2252/BmrU family lipid kinase [Segniliparus rugosus]EFV11886.1 YegS//BmrU family lipid kinase [Segniliparus rugosus ATCC BAA-974]
MSQFDPAGRIRSAAAVVNPKAAKVAEEALAALRAAGIAVRGQDEEADALVVVGGDGTMAQVLPHAVRRGAPVGLIPAGTGNDLARVLGTPRHDPVAAASVVSSGNTRLFDLGEIRTETDGRSTLFGTVAAIGFDALVSERANRMRWPKGKSRYVLATFAELGRLAPRRLRFEVDGEVFEHNAALAAIGNTSSYGGGMRICPDADPGDGLLELTVVEHSSRLRLLRFFPTVFKGSHLGLAEVTAYRGASISVRCADSSGPQPLVYADGERVGTLPCAITAKPGALRFIVP